jgi:Fe-S cluster biogenesis protein NfuA
LPGIRLGKRFAYTSGMTTSDMVETVLERLRPALNADGGDIELVNLEGDVVRVRLTGACAGCASAEMTLRVGVEGALRRVRPGLRVVPVL